jgi:hypothetical protein
MGVVCVDGVVGGSCGGRDVAGSDFDEDEADVSGILLSDSVLSELLGLLCMFHLVADKLEVYLLCQELSLSSL